MILKDNLYRITASQTSDESAFYRLSINKDWDIYKAHFPGHPVTPGVCIIQTAVELVEAQLGQHLMLTRVKNVKFLSVLSPNDTVEVICEITALKILDGEVSFLAVVRSDTAIFAKLSLTCSTCNR